MAVDAVFFGAHPDDVELTSAGLAALLASHGHRVALVDLTRGEGASRGTVEDRAREAAEAARLLGVVHRESLGLPDGGLDGADHAQRVAVVSCLRAHRPTLVVAPHADDAHPDHVEAARLVAAACYLAGLARFPASGERWRPARLLHAIYWGGQPRIVVDVTAVWDKRMAALRAHASQLDPAAGPSTYLTEPGFLDEVEARARLFGAQAGGTYGEGYDLRGPLVLRDARVLLSGEALHGR